MSNLALISDLMMQSHVSGAAARAGTTLKIVGSSETLMAEAAAGQPALVILDLSHPGLDPHDLIPRLKELLPPGAVTVAFGPHVHHERLHAAQEAGCDLVVSRGQFHAQTEEILKRYAGE
jgi:DNA-binding NarL/FixJ family response regulator